jgi:hypothetical protein
MTDFAGDPPVAVGSPSRSGQLLVLEIGVGDRRSLERPNTRGAYHFAVDVDRQTVAAQTGPRLVADAVALPVADGTVDLVVARNVFGDVGLGHSFEEVTGSDPDRYAAHVRDLLRRGAFDEARQIRARISLMVRAAEETKVQILADSARALVEGGRLLVIETMTPRFAVEFFRRHSRSSPGRVRGGRSRDRTVTELSCAPFDLTEVQGYARRSRVCLDDELADDGLKVWLLDRRPR